MKHFVIICLFFVTIISCKKKEDDSCSSCSVGGGTEPTGFYFAKNSGGTIKADSAYFYPSTKTIIAYYQGMTNRVIIKTSAQSVGIYGFTTTANTCKYIEPLGILLPMALSILRQMLVVKCLVILRAAVVG